MGTVSSSILGPATENTPQQNPKKYLPIRMHVKFSIIVNEVAIAAKTLKIIRQSLLPLVINLPPTREPDTTPKMAAALIKVLYRVASSLSHPNLALMTGAV